MLEQSEPRGDQRQCTMGGGGEGTCMVITSSEVRGFSPILQMNTSAPSESNLPKVMQLLSVCLHSKAEKQLVSVLGIRNVGGENT